MSAAPAGVSAVAISSEPANAPATDLLVWDLPARDRVVIEFSFGGRIRAPRIVDIFPRRRFERRGFVGPARLRNRAGASGGYRANTYSIEAVDMFLISGASP